MAVVLVAPTKALATYNLIGLDTNGVQGMRQHPVEFALPEASLALDITELWQDIQDYGTRLEVASKAVVESVSVSFKGEPSAYAVPVEAELWQEAVISVRLEGLGQKIGTIVIPAPVNEIISSEGAVLYNDAIVTNLASAYKANGETGSLDALLSDGENVRGTNFMEAGKLRYRSRKAR